jgi:regulator of protease activity HflC (stomatin/prohibitin superfamily)
MRTGFLFLVATILLLVALAWLALRLWQLLMRPGGVFTTVYEWQHALLYVDGKFRGVLPPGRHSNLGGLTRRDIYVMRKTEQLETVSQVDVTSSNRFVFRLSATVTYQITDPRTAYETAYLEKLRLAFSAALVNLAAERLLDAFLNDRPKLDRDLLSKIPAALCGCEIKAAAIVAVVLPPEVRRMFTDVERAKLEGLSALERARGEQAALRLLANAARMLKGNPELMNLRVLQALAGSSGKSQPTIVLGQGALVPITRGEGEHEIGPDD